MNNNGIGLIILLGILFLAIFGGATNHKIFSTSTSSSTPKAFQSGQTSQSPNQYSQNTYGQGSYQSPTQNSDETQSQYYGQITLSYVTRSTNPSQEYLTMNASYSLKNPIDITGWTLHSTNTGATVTIPKGTYLYFQDSANSEEDIWASPQDTIYVITGNSPINYSFKSNKCTGYLNQYTSFVPYLNSSCPTARDEDQSSLSPIAGNDSCFSYLDSLQQCRVDTNPPNNLSYECTNFVNHTLNYTSCVDLHKLQDNFYQHEWRVYLKRSVSIWKNTRENIILTDREGKIVSTLTY